MKFSILDFRFLIFPVTAIFVVALFGKSLPALAQGVPAANGMTNIFLVDLPAALHLAGARNLDVQLAREKLAEAKANNESARLQFFPWLSVGAGYRRHDGLIQDTTGAILDVHKQSYAPGGALMSHLDFGEAIYNKLAAKQFEHAAEYALEAQRQESVAVAAQGYFDLAFTQAAVGVSQEAVRISTNYEGQVQRALDLGLAFKGDLLRVSVQAERNRVALRQAVEKQQVAAARLAQILHLDPSIELVARDTDLAPIALIETNATVSSLIARAVCTRPELKQGQAFLQAAREDKNGIVYGPLIPSVMGQVSAGGLGGGKGNDWGNFGAQQDYAVGIGWRLGPGGLLDFGRQHAASARLSSAHIGLDKLHDEVVRQVVEAFARLQSEFEQINTTRRALADAEEGLRLARQRQEFGVGVVLENILAEQDLTGARNDHLKSIAEFNKVQYAVSRAVGFSEASP